VPAFLALNDARQRPAGRFRSPLCPAPLVELLLDDGKGVAIHQCGHRVLLGSLADAAQHFPVFPTGTDMGVTDISPFAEQSANLRNGP
jgi:hypothetical protein